MKTCIRIALIIIGTLIVAMIAVKIDVMINRTFITECEKIKIGSSVDSVFAKMGNRFEMKKIGTHFQYTFPSAFISGQPPTILVDEVSRKVTALICSEDDPRK
tara:strand:+ start:246 stop:554 length:309 start_codon:yes stop_codon:yes gene_type:complete